VCRCVVSRCGSGAVFVFKITDTAVGAANAAGRKLTEPLVQKDASAQAERMVGFLADNPDCEIYKTRMREAGRGSPYEATTQRGFVQTQQDACKAGCCKQK
jgi:hypothetical protein